MKKTMSLTKKIGIFVLVFTEFMIVFLLGISFYKDDIEKLFSAGGMQMIVFASFWGVKALADNVKTIKGVSE